MTSATLDRMNRLRAGVLLLAGLLSGGGALAHPPFANEPGLHAAGFAHRDVTIEPVDERVLGPVSFYARRFAGRRTASGERFDPEALTMAHPTLPFGTQVRVSVPGSDRSVVVRVNDRGPFEGSRIADVSPAAARILGILQRGLAYVRLEILSSAAGSRPTSSRSDH